ncbi:alanine racemase [Endomicrobiia bacterium]|nr:alanine racemase [Endomicrobiia bacterium]GHT11508.1 alanine racemase [Endomicrobiia bacterium]GHT21283.1 alanine racemase [Endomicrobiia bacterium]GHT27505.1 alanine racemase [Endomicrobiia bacterium]GHT29394.1 alanine racemase [Endomicrobiia bacterium]
MKKKMPSVVAVTNKTRQTVFFRQNWVEIDRSDFHFNLKKIKEYIAKDTKIMVVIKANAYGHGGVALAKETQRAGVAWIGISSLEEGIQFREAGIKSNILILGNIFPFENFQVAVAHSLTPTISTMSGLAALEYWAVRLNKKINFHLKIDSGMGRIGVVPEASYPILQKIVQMPKTNMTGMYTHFAVADTDPVFTQQQLDIFSNIVKFARINLGLKFIAHAANSAALFRNKRTHLDMVRPGISIYGLTPFKHAERFLKLKSVLSWKTKIIFLKKVPAGFCVSYGRTFVTNRASVIATIPVGYADGYNRLLSNKCDVLVRGKRCPIAGRITMDMTMIDVTDVKGVTLGDEVVLIGVQGKEHIKVDELAKIQNTINYEVTSSISVRVPRIVV